MQFPRRLRIALAQLRRTPTTTSATVLTLALGIGAATTVYTLVDGVLVRPLPVTEEAELLSPALTRLDQGGHYTVNWHTFEGLREETRAFDSVSTGRAESVRVRTAPDAAPAKLSAARVTGNWFSTLGLEVASGRGLLPSDSREDGGPAQPVVVLSQATAQRLFGDPAPLDATLDIDGADHRIVGVHAHPEIAGLLLYDLLLPLSIDAETARQQPEWGFKVIGPPQGRNRRRHGSGQSRGRGPAYGRALSGVQRGLGESRFTRFAGGSKALRATDCSPCSELSCSCWRWR